MSLHSLKDPGPGSCRHLYLRLNQALQDTGPVVVAPAANLWTPVPNRHGFLEHNRASSRLRCSQICWPRATAARPALSAAAPPPLGPLAGGSRGFGRREPGSGLLGPGCNGRPQLPDSLCKHPFCLQARAALPAGQRALWAPRPGPQGSPTGAIDHPADRQPPFWREALPGQPEARRETASARGSWERHWSVLSALRPGEAWRSKAHAWAQKPPAFCSPTPRGCALPPPGWSPCAAPPPETHPHPAALLPSTLTRRPTPAPPRSLPAVCPS